MSATWYLIAGVAVAALWISKGFLRKTFIAGKKFEGKVDLNGKIVIVTGANSGIGFETSKYLARHGAKVIMACRSRDKAMEAIELINEDTAKNAVIPNGSAVFMQLDLGSFASVRKFAEEVIKEYSNTGIHLLINNAGLVFAPFSLTPDKLETMFATNHLGHYLLTRLLLPLIETGANKTGEARIVNVASKVHTSAPPKGIDWDHVNDEVEYNRVRQYCVSKLANIQFTYELQRRLNQVQRTGIITVNTLHPGSAATDVLKDLPAWFRALGNGFMNTFLKTPEEAAQTSIYLSVAPQLKGIGGKYFRDSTETPSSPISYSLEAQKLLWERSEKFVGL